MLSTKSFYIKLIAVLLTCCPFVVFGQTGTLNGEQMMDAEQKRKGPNMPGMKGMGMQGEYYDRAEMEEMTNNWHALNQCANTIRNLLPQIPAGCTYTNPYNGSTEKLASTYPEYLSSKKQNWATLEKHFNELSDHSDSCWSDMDCTSYMYGTVVTTGDGIARELNTCKTRTNELNRALRDGEEYGGTCIANSESQKIVESSREALQFIEQSEELAAKALAALNSQSHNRATLDSAHKLVDNARNSLIEAKSNIQSYLEEN